MRIWCSQCGAESTVPETYATESSLLGRRRRYCPLCWRNKQERKAGRRLPRLIVTSLSALVLIVISITGADPRFGALGWIAANVCLLALFMEIVTIPHELGHALMARLLGLRVFSITVGIGPRVLEANVRGVRFRLHAYPFGGSTVIAPIDGRLFRLKQLLVLAAGPSINGLLLAAALLFGGDFRIGAISKGLRPATTLVAANLVLLVLNLVPLRVAGTAGPALANDGLATLQVAFGSARERREMLAARYVLEAMTCREGDLLPEARSWLEQGIIAFPRSPLLHLELGLTLALLGDCEEARRQFLLILELPDVPAAAQALARNNVAWADFVTAPNDRLDEADRFSREALRTFGWIPALKGTRGAVLVELGRVDEGLVLLHSAVAGGRDEDLHPMARATYWGAIALGLLTQGRVQEAREHLAAARRYYPRCPLLPRVEAAIAQRAGVAVGAEGLRPSS